MIPPITPNDHNKNNSKDFFSSMTSKTTFDHNHEYNDDNGFNNKNINFDNDDDDEEEDQLMIKRGSNNSTYTSTTYNSSRPPSMVYTVHDDDNDDGDDDDDEQDRNNFCSGLEIKESMSSITTSPTILQQQQPRGRRQKEMLTLLEEYGRESEIIQASASNTTAQQQPQKHQQMEEKDQHMLLKENDSASWNIQSAITYSSRQSEGLSYASSTSPGCRGGTPNSNATNKLSLSSGGKGGCYDDRDDWFSDSSSEEENGDDGDGGAMDYYGDGNLSYGSVDNSSEGRHQRPGSSPCGSGGHGGSNNHVSMAKYHPRPRTSSSITTTTTAQASATNTEQGYYLNLDIISDASSSTGSDDLENDLQSAITYSSRQSEGAITYSSRQSEGLSYESSTSPGRRGGTPNYNDKMDKLGLSSDLDLDCSLGYDETTMIEAEEVDLDGFPLLGGTTTPQYQSSGCGVACDTRVDAELQSWCGGLGNNEEEDDTDVSYSQSYRSGKRYPIEREEDHHEVHCNDSSNNNDNNHHRIEWKTMEETPQIERKQRRLVIDTMTHNVNKAELEAEAMEQAVWDLRSPESTVSPMNANNRARVLSSSSLSPPVGKVAVYTPEEKVEVIVDYPPLEEGHCIDEEVNDDDDDNYSDNEEDEDYNNQNPFLIPQQMYSIDENEVKAKARAMMEDAMRDLHFTNVGGIGCNGDDSGVGNFSSMDNSSITSRPPSFDYDNYDDIGHIYKLTECEGEEEEEDYSVDRSEINSMMQEIEEVELRAKAMEEAVRNLDSPYEDIDVVITATDHSILSSLSASPSVVAHYTANKKGKGGKQQKQQLLKSKRRDCSSDHQSLSTANTSLEQQGQGQGQQRKSKEMDIDADTDHHHNWDVSIADIQVVDRQIPPKPTILEEEEYKFDDDDGELASGSTIEHNISSPIHLTSAFHQYNSEAHHRPMSALTTSTTTSIDSIEQTSLEMKREVDAFLQSTQLAIQASRELYLDENDGINYEINPRCYGQQSPTIEAMRCHQPSTGAITREIPEVYKDTTAVRRSAENVLRQRHTLQDEKVQVKDEELIQGGDFLSETSTTDGNELCSPALGLPQSRPSAVQFERRKRRGRCDMTLVKVSLFVGILSFIIGLMCNNRFAVVG